MGWKWQCMHLRNCLGCCKSKAAIPDLLEFSRHTKTRLLAIIESSFRIMWRIIQIKETVIKVKAEVDNGTWDLHNSSHHTKAKFNNFFIIHSKYFQGLIKITSSQSFLLTLAYFVAQVQDINRCFYVIDTLSIEQWFFPLNFGQKFGFCNFR